MIVLGIDIGGKSFKCAVVRDDGSILEQIAFLPDYSKGQDFCLSHFLEQMEGWLSSLPLSESLAGIGIGCPGLIDSELGICKYSNNLGWRDLPLSKIFEQRFGLPCYITNDANAAMAGEMRFGSYRYDNAILLTLGTGVGGGIFLDGKLFEGVGGMGAELGHTVLVKGGNLCTCGRQGCFETYASATALETEAERRLPNHPESALNDGKITAKAVFVAAKAGDKLAKELLDWYIENLGEGIINLINVFRPSAILLGGGVSKAGDDLLLPLKSYLEKEHYGYAREYGNPIAIEIASLSNDAGVLGAAALVFAKKDNF